MRIDWKERDRALRRLFDKYRGNGSSGYDCICPISGGKDSAFQLYLLTQVYNMKPLAVTFSHNWFSETGRKNLQTCLETFDVDHLMFTPSRGLVNRTARHSLKMIGDTCWHCHAGVGAFPLRAAVMYKIPLLVFGESAAENSASAEYDKIIEYDRDYFTKVSAFYTPEQFSCDYLSAQDLRPFDLPSHQELEEVGVVGIHIGNYVFWDDERQMEFMRDFFGWQEDNVEGTYKGYKSVECKMPGMHDYTKFLKRGYGRATDHVTRDVRAGLMTLEEAYKLARKHDPVQPDAINEYLELSGYSLEEFHAIMDEHREKLDLVSKEEIEAAMVGTGHIKKADHFNKK